MNVLETISVSFHRLPDDIWLIDLDANKIISPDKARIIPPLPQPDGTILKNHLRQVIV